MGKKTTKKTPQRIPRYVGAEGEYLAIDDREYIIKIGWYFPDDGEYGLMIENALRADTPDNNVVVETLKTFFRDYKLGMPRPNAEFEFESMREANEALRLCNAALYYWQQNKKLPDWAEKAAAAGWSPPKGWKP